MQSRVIIPKPCLVSQQALTPTDAGWHCTRCQIKMTDSPNSNFRNSLRATLLLAGIIAGPKSQAQTLPTFLAAATTSSPQSDSARLTTQPLIINGIVYNSRGSLTSGVAVILHLNTYFTKTEVIDKQRRTVSGTNGQFRFVVASDSVSEASISAYYPTHGRRFQFDTVAVDSTSGSSYALHMKNRKRRRVIRCGPFR